MTRAASPRLANVLVLLATVAAVSLCPSPARAEDDAKKEFQAWSAVVGTMDLTRTTPAPSLWLDVHARRGDAGTVGIVRPGVGATLSKFASVWGGYAWIPVHSDATDARTDEHRIWTQIIMQHKNRFRLALQSRTRFEHRFSESGSDVGHRVRQFVRAGWEPSPRVPVGLVVWDELLLGLNNTAWGAPQGFDQNRVFAGVALPIPPWSRVEIGYLHVHVDRVRGDTAIHGVAINLFVAPQLPKR